MKKRINLLYMIMALVTIVASVSIACTVFYNVLKHEVLEDMHNYIDVFIGADAWGMVTDPDNIVEQKVIDNYDGNLRITFINSQGYAIVDTLVDIDKMENHNERPEVVAARRNGYGCDIRDRWICAKSFKGSKQYDEYYDKYAPCYNCVMCNSLYNLYDKFTFSDKKHC